MSKYNQSNRWNDLIASLTHSPRPPAVMGILNVTPDSFSDGGAYFDTDRAVAHAQQMIADGAELIDVGGESTRPGSEPVPPAEQTRRTVPVIDSLRSQYPEIVLTIDTQSAAVATAAIEAGADAVNDISALQADSAMAALVAGRGVGVILMHMRGTPKTMQTADGGPMYKNVAAEVTDFLRQRVQAAQAAGVAPSLIVVDPGLGFGKTVEHNLALLQHLDRLVALGYPVLVGASRKSFIGQLTGAANPADRLAGSLACATAATLAGAKIIRTHNVAPTRQAILMAAALSL